MSDIKSGYHETKEIEKAAGDLIITRTVVVRVSEGLCCNYDIIICLQSDGWEPGGPHGKLGISHNMNVSYFDTWILSDDG